jgi:XRE family transcriptional regulator of biofilm formation
MSGGRGNGKSGAAAQLRHDKGRGMIGTNINHFRTQSGISLSELAERAGISKSYLSSIERNLKKNPSIQVIEKIALVLNVDLKTLLQVNLPDPEAKETPDEEWYAFVEALRQAGIEKDNVQDYKILIEFIKWYQERKQG